MTSFRSLMCLPEPATHPSRPGCHQPRSPSMPHMATRASERHGLLCEVLTASAGLGSLAPAAVPWGPACTGVRPRPLHTTRPASQLPPPSVACAGFCGRSWAYTFQHQETELSCTVWAARLLWVVKSVGAVRCVCGMHEILCNWPSGLSLQERICWAGIFILTRAIKCQSGLASPLVPLPSILHLAASVSL